MNSATRQKPRLPVSKDGFNRLVSGHPWLFKSHLSNEFAAHFGSKNLQAGLYPLGEHWFLFSTHSEISLRRFGPATRLWPSEIAEDQRKPILEPAEFEKHFAPWLVNHFKERYQFKNRLLPNERCFRWIFSECDLLPGLIVDVFENDLVAQIQTEPLELFWPIISKYLCQAFQSITGQNPQLHELRKSKSRLKEGLLVEDAVVDDSKARWIAWNGLKWWMNPAHGQKTGAYFDQKDNHWAAVHWAKTLNLKDAWDLCCFEGGFGLHLANNGLQVLAVDESQRALDTVLKNATENTIKGLSTKKADVFDFLKSHFDQKSKVDMIVLDPPGVAGNKKNLVSALKGLKELNLRAMHCLKPGGLLVTCTCSHSIGQQELSQVIKEAMHDSRRTVRVLERRGPSADHAPLVGFPESEYLQAWFLEVQ